MTAHSAYLSVKKCMCFQRVSHASHSVWVQNYLWAVVEQHCLWSHCSDIAHSDCTVNDSNDNDVVVIIVVIVIIREEGEGDREESKDREDEEEDSLFSSVKEAGEEEDTDYVSDSSHWYNSADDELIDEL